MFRNLHRPARCRGGHCAEIVPLTLVHAEWTIYLRCEPSTTHEMGTKPTNMLVWILRGDLAPISLLSTLVQLSFRWHGRTEMGSSE